MFVIYWVECIAVGKGKWKCFLKYTNCTARHGTYSYLVSSRLVFHGAEMSIRDNEDCSTVQWRHLHFALVLFVLVREGPNRIESGQDSGSGRKGESECVRRADLWFGSRRGWAPRAYAPSGTPRPAPPRGPRAGARWSPRTAGSPWESAGTWTLCPRVWVYVDKWVLWTIKWAQWISAVEVHAGRHTITQVAVYDDLPMSVN